MKKLLTSIIACSLIIVGIAGCSSNEKIDEEETPKADMMTSQ